MSKLFAGLLLAGATAVAADVVQLEKSFREPPPEARIMMRWWWFGPAVTKDQLEREMRLMKLGGIGGFEVQPTYPLEPDNESKGFRNLVFLSEEFLEALRFTAEKARELGLRMDLTLGSGWPYGGPQISIDHAAGRLRVERVRRVEASSRVPLPSMESGEELIAVFAGPVKGSGVDASALEQVKEIRDGAVWLPPRMGRPAEVLFFISSRTGMQVKRPAVGAEGYVLNHYDRRALDHYLKTVGERLLSAFGSNPPYAIFCDSLEVYQSDWTPDFLAEFQKRRGYDLVPHLPALVMDVGPHTPEVRRDWAKTLTELYEERFARPMQEWARKMGTRFRIQGYGIPPAVPYSYRYADLPEGEGHQWKGFSTSRWAASAGHLLGHEVISSETWTWLHSPSFRATPLDMKAEADRHFLQGINQLIGHGWPYTAEGVEYPGWRFYAAAVFNDRNPWWPVMPDIALYLQRASWMLRQGRPAMDVLLYLPVEDAYVRFAERKPEELDRILARLVGTEVPAQILDAGFNFDFVDDGLLEHRARVTKEALVFDALRYRAVVLPSVERVPLGTMRKLLDFAQLGGVVVATGRLPGRVPGFGRSEGEQQQLRELVNKLFEVPGAPGIFVKNEKELGAALRSRLRPDVELAPAAPDVGFVHRTDGKTEIYFIANTGNQPQSLRARVRVHGLNPEWWDPMSGGISPVEVIERSEATTTVRLELPPYGSGFLVFSSRQLRGGSARVASRQRGEIDCSTDWEVEFGGSGRKVRMQKLRSWTDDEQTRYFSGVATYRRAVDIPAKFVTPGTRLWLDLGEAKPAPMPSPAERFRAALEAPVREAAVVYVNGEKVGSVWCPPYRIELTGRLKPGRNELRIEVGNLAINHLAGQSLPDYRLLNLRYGVRFTPQDMKDLQPVPSGLLGPVRIVAEEAAAQ